MFEQVKNKKYYMQIVDQIRNLISEGKLKIGDKLPPERELTIEFGTSRACIREALSALEILGLIESKSGQGNYIKADGKESSIDGELIKTLILDHSPYEIYESRLELEPCMAALAAERGTREEKIKLHDQVVLLDKLGKDIEEDIDKIEEYMEEDRKYHLLIGRCAHNSVLFMVFSAVNLMMKEAHWKTIKSKGVKKKGNISKYAEEHNSIYTAIKDSKPEAARTQMYRHLLDIKKDLFE